jgi:hypothetical protein
MTIKRFIVQAPGVKFIKLFFSGTDKEASIS